MLLNISYYVLMLPKLYNFVVVRDLSEISRGEGGWKQREGHSQRFETAEKGGVMKNGLLKEGGSSKYLSVIM